MKKFIIFAAIHCICIASTELFNLSKPPIISQESIIANFILKFTLKPIDDPEGVQALKDKLAVFIRQKEPIILFFKGFPFKATYSGKCISDEPDLAEYLAAKRLIYITTEIGKIYAPGCYMNIYSDAYPYSLPWDPSDDIKKLYLTKVSNLFNDTNIEFFATPRGLSPEELRKKMSQICRISSKKPTDDLRQWVKHEYRLWKGITPPEPSRWSTYEEMEQQETINHEAEKILKQYFEEQECFRYYLQKLFLQIGSNLLFIIMEIYPKSLFNSSLEPT